MKGFLTPALLVSALALSGCELTDEEKEKLDNAAVDLQQLADQIIITYPANDSEVSDSMVTVRADIPTSADAQEVRLLVDGIEIAKDTDGAPWEIQWPAYYFADGGKHTLLLKTITGEGNEVRNNEQFQVTVTEAANEALAFNAGVNGAQIQNTNTFIVDFSAFPEASSYDVKYDDKTITTAETAAELTDLGVGTHTIQYRALHSSIQDTPYSAPVTIEVLPPELPIINQPIVESKSEGYEVTLSWEAINPDDSYEVHWGPAGNLASIGNTSNSSFTLSSLELGNYEYTLRRTNSLGQQSIISEVTTVNVGTFNTRLGGSGNDTSKQIISSQIGGYLILATTESYEVSESVNGVDDWVIRLDEQGNMTAQYVSNAVHRDRISSIVEADDGSIFLAGKDWESKKALLIKLNSSLEKEWEILYQPVNTTERYDFGSLLFWNSKLFVGATLWKTTGNFTTADAPYLHEINKMDGSISTPISLPILADITPNSIRLLITSSNNLAIYGTADSTNPDADISGAYLSQVNSNFELITSWNDVGQYQLDNVKSVIELSNGRFALGGEARLLGRAIISIVNQDGTLHNSYEDSYFNYSFSNLASNNQGGFYSLYQSTLDGFPTVVTEYNENIVRQNTQILQEDAKQSNKLIKNSDDSFTILFDSGDWNYRDINIGRIPLNN